MRRRRHYDGRTTNNLLPKFEATEVCHILRKRILNGCPNVVRKTLTYSEKRKQSVEFSDKMVLSVEIEKGYPCWVASIFR